MVLITNIMNVTKQTNKPCRFDLSFHLYRNGRQIASEMVLAVTGLAVEMAEHQKATVLRKGWLDCQRELHLCNCTRVKETVQYLQDCSERDAIQSSKTGSQLSPNIFTL